MAFGKQNEHNEQSEEAPSEKSESQQDDNNNSGSEEDELPLSQTKMTKPESLNIIMERAQKTLQDTFDETRETCLEQNPWMKIVEAEKKAFGEL